MSNVKEQLNQLSKALLTLSELERKCIIFRYYDNKSLEEISNIINVPIKDLNIINNTALNKLENKLDFLQE